MHDVLKYDKASRSLRKIISSSLQYTCRVISFFQQHILPAINERQRHAVCIIASLFGNTSEPISPCSTDTGHMQETGWRLYCTARDSANLRFVGLPIAQGGLVTHVLSSPGEKSLTVGKLESTLFLPVSNGDFIPRRNTCINCRQELPVTEFRCPMITRAS